MLRLEGDAGEVVVLHSSSAAASAPPCSTPPAPRRPRGLRALWLITTNDNVEAIRFYQRCGWDWVEFHRDSPTESRG